MKNVVKIKKFKISLNFLFKFFKKIINKLKKIRNFRKEHIHNFHFQIN